MHHIQANVAFIRDRKNVRFYEITNTWPFAHDLAASWVLVQPIGGGREEYWVIQGGRERLAEVLGRPDVTRRNGNPLAVGNDSKGVFGIAVGPETPPPDVAITGVFDLDRQVLIATDPGQPEWWLFDGEEDDPFTYVGASAWGRDR